MMLIAMEEVKQSNKNILKKRKPSYLFSKGVCILDKDVSRVKVTMHKVFNKNLPIQNKRKTLNIQHHKFTDSLLCIHTVLTPYKNGSSDAAANNRGSY